MNKKEIKKLSDHELDLGIAQIAGIRHRLSEFNRGLDGEKVPVLISDSKLGILSFVNDWSNLIPLVLKNHIQLYVHTENHYTIDDGDCDGFGELSVHIDEVGRVLAECLYKVLTTKGE